MSAVFTEPEEGFTARRAAGAAAFAAGLGLYGALAAAAAVIYPPLAAVFLVPFAAGVFFLAPSSRAAPRQIALRLILMAAFLFPVWPVYVFVKIGPMPILTPPRLLLYAASAMWLYDMTFSRLRRAQFALVFKRSGLVAALPLSFVALGVFSLVTAEGRALAATELFRQTLIWFLPYCAIVTYCRREQDFTALLRWLIIGAVIAAIIAIGEALTHRLLASYLTPMMSGDTQWLTRVQLQKIRDGVFRAQSSHTHPLSLGEQMAMSAPFALAFALGAKEKRARWLWFAGLAAILLGAVATNSRGAALGLGMAMTGMAVIVIWRFLRQASAVRFRPLIGLFAAFALLSAPVVAVGAAAMISGKGGVSASNSTQARIDQVESAWPKVLKRPIGGYGTGRSTRVLGFWGQTLTIDNYYLSLALDYGFPGPAAFLAMLAAFAVSGFRRVKGARADLAAIYLAVPASAAAIAVSRLVMSQTGNITIFLILIAAFAGSGVSLARRRQRPEYC